MVKLLELKEQIKNFYAEHEGYMQPLFKFLVIFISQVIIKFHFQVDNIVSSWIIIVAASVIFAFMPWSLIVTGLLAAIIIDIFSLSMELAGLVLMLILVMLILFFRFTPNQGLFLIFVPLAFFIQIPYLIPIAAGLLFAPTAVVSVTFGTLLYYIIDTISTHKEAITNIASGDNTPTGSFTIVNMVTGNTEMYLIMASFVVTVLVVYFIRRMSINNAWMISIISGGLLNFVIILVGSLVLKIDYSTVGLIIGAVISVILAYILQFFVFSLDYTRTEHTQFEDDEYYYYVKAVPKINVTAPAMNVKRINAQRKKKNFSRGNRK